MKKIICLICSVAFALAISSCASTKVNENKPKKYREFTSHEIYDHSDFLEKVGYGNFNLKIKESQIYGQKSDDEINIRINQLDVDSREYCLKTPDILERLEEDRKYTAYISIKREGNLLSGYTFTPILDDIEGLRSIDVINRERLEKEKAEREVKEKQAKELKAKIEKIAQGYTIHGVEEASQNATLFNKGALEPGHAYYLELFMTKAGGNFGSALKSIFSSPEYNYVTYISQKVRGEVTSAGSTFMGQIPVSVIVIGGNAPAYVPVVLGLVE